MKIKQLNEILEGINEVPEPGIPFSKVIRPWNMFEQFPINIEIKSYELKTGLKRFDLKHDYDNESNERNFYIETASSFGKLKSVLVVQQFPLRYSNSTMPWDINIGYRLYHNGKKLKALSQLKGELAYAARNESKIKIGYLAWKKFESQLDIPSTRCELGDFVKNQEIYFRGFEKVNSCTYKALESSRSDYSTFSLIDVLSFVLGGKESVNLLEKRKKWGDELIVENQIIDLSNCSRSSYDYRPIVRNLKTGKEENIWKLIK